MAGQTKRWEEEEEDSSSSGSGSSSEAPAVTVPAGRRKFDDEEAEDSDVLDSWDAAEDSEVEREKAKKAAELKAKAEAEAAANKKSKAQRVAERQAERARQLAEEDSSDDEETEAQKRDRLRRTEKEADLRHAEDLFAGVGGVTSRKTTNASVIIDPSNPNSTVDLADLPVFNPTTKTQFETLRTTLVPLLTAHSKKPHYGLFLQEFAKQLAKELQSDQIKKVASTLTTLSNEKMKEEKAAEKGGKKSKAAKTKTTLAGVGRPTAAADVSTYDDDAFGDDDFM